MAALDKLLKSLVDRQMEVLLLEPGSRPRMRKHGAEHDVSSSILAGPTIEALLVQVAPEGIIAGPPAADTAEFDYANELDEFRFSCLRTDDGWSALVVAGSNGEPEAFPAAAMKSAESETEESSPAAAARPAGEQLIASIGQILQVMLDRGASDLHLSSHQTPRLRIDGALKPLEEYSAPLPEWLEQIIDDIIPERNRKEYESRKDTDFAYALDDLARFRVNVFCDRLGVGAVFRVIPSTIPTFEELGLPAVLRDVSSLSKGLVLVTGPTGSGKSTTLAALVDLVNSERHDHIITIEDPIEFVHESKGCLVHQREVGVHTGSFKQALRAALREDPDVVMVGEMRELEAVAMTLEAAETGHLVFGSLPTTTAVSTIERIVNQFPPDRQAQVRMMLSDGLHAVVSQTLVRKAGGGMVAAHEILINTPAVSELIRENQTAEISATIEGQGDEGMCLLNQSLMRLVSDGVVEPLDAYIKSVEKADFSARLDAAASTSWSEASIE